MSPLTRRSFLRASAGAGAGALVLGTRIATSSASTPYFLHGVASGDPLPTCVVLWTRVTPTPDALPGSGTGPVVTVRWQVRSEEHTSELQSHHDLVCRLLLEKKKKKT